MWIKIKNRFIDLSLIRTIAVDRFDILFFYKNSDCPTEIHGSEIEIKEIEKQLEDILDNNCGLKIFNK